MSQHDPSRLDPTEVEMPAPTFWPMALAFGLMLAFAGIITHIAVTVVGLIVAARAGYGWWRDVIPHEKHEMIPALPEPAPPVSLRSVTSLAPGKEEHRVHIPERVPGYSSGLTGGLVGGAVMAALACLYGLVAKGSIWYPINLLAAGALPALAALNDREISRFNLTGLLVAIIIHGVLCMLVGLLYAVALPMFPRRAWLWAGIMAPLFWSALIASSLDLINPALRARISWPWFVACQLGYGVFGGYVIARANRIDTMQGLSFTERAALKAPPPRDTEHGG